MAPSSGLRDRPMALGVVARLGRGGAHSLTLSVTCTTRHAQHDMQTSTCTLRDAELDMHIATCRTRHAQHDFGDGFGDADEKKEENQRDTLIGNKTEQLPVKKEEPMEEHSLQPEKQSTEPTVINPKIKADELVFTEPTEELNQIQDIFK